MSLGPGLIGIGAATAAAASAFLVHRRPPLMPDSSGQPPPGRLEPVADHAMLRRLRTPLVVLVVFGSITMLGAAAGLPIGGVLALVAWRVLGSAEGPRARRRRLELENDLPMAVHLLGACLRSGAATAPSLITVSTALPGAVAEEFRAIAAALEFGTDPGSVWESVAEGSRGVALVGLGRALARAHRSGASVSTAVEQLSEDLRSASRLRVEGRARTVEVRATAPLGGCLLPAFVLLGIVPMVAGLVAALDFFR